jgi:hypothetical protein
VPVRGKRLPAALQGSGWLPQAGVVLVLELGRHILKMLERDRSMARIVAQWSDTVERSIQQRLGNEQTNKPDEAA